METLLREHAAMEMGEFIFWLLGGLLVLAILIATLKKLFPSLDRPAKHQGVPRQHRRQP